ncbi:MAG: hypothetical protein QOE63_1824 [Acidimicrobiaceae bacterium]
MELRSVAVYCGSSSGTDPALAAAAAELGEVLAAQEIALVYGGGRVGLMGVVADAVLASGGQVTGVITEALAAREVAHRGVTDLVIVATMHERKAMMSARADAFIALPGGYGTLDELFEAVTWTQLGVHAKPCGLLDTTGFFEHLLSFLDVAVEQGFVRAEHRHLLLHESDASVLLDRFRAWLPVSTAKWTDGVRP